MREYLGFLFVCLFVCLFDCLFVFLLIFFVCLFLLLFFFTSINLGKAPIFVFCLVNECPEKLMINQRKRVQHPLKNKNKQKKKNQKKIRKKSKKKNQSPQTPSPSPPLPPPPPTYQRTPHPKRITSIWVFIGSSLKSKALPL